MSGKAVRMSLRLLSPERPFIVVEYRDGKLSLGFSKDEKKWTWITTDGEITYSTFPRAPECDSFERDGAPYSKWPVYASFLQHRVLESAARLGHNPGRWKGSSTDYFRWDRYVHCLNCGKVGGYDQDGKVDLFTEKCGARYRYWIDSGRSGR